MRRGLAACAGATQGAQRDGRRRRRELGVPAHKKRQLSLLLSRALPARCFASARTRSRRPAARPARARQGCPPRHPVRTVRPCTSARLGGSRCAASAVLRSRLSWQRLRRRRLRAAGRLGTRARGCCSRCLHAACSAGGGAGAHASVRHAHAAPHVLHASSRRRGKFSRFGASLSLLLLHAAPTGSNRLHRRLARRHATNAGCNLTCDL